MAKASRFADRRGISMLVVVILVLVTIAIVTTALLLYARWVEMERIYKDLQKVKKAEEALRDERRVVLRNQMPPTDLADAATELKDLTDGKPKAELEKRRNELLMTIAEKPGDETTTASNLKALKDSGAFDTLQSLVEIAAYRMEAQHNRMRNLQAELEIAKAQADRREAIRPELVKSKQAYKTELQAKIAKINQEIAEENNVYNDRKTVLTTQRDEATAAAETEREDFYRWEIRMKNEIRELQRQLEELKVKETIRHEISATHGRVLRPDIPNKVAFIDIGSRDRVVPGLRFLVAKRGDQGKFEYKGSIEVKKVWMTYAEVAIHDVYKTDIPIIEGDLIVNPLFNRYRPIVVAFAGEERPVRLRPAWSTAEVTRRLKEIGSRVEPEPNLDVDFVIFTEEGVSSGVLRQRNSYDAYNQAVLLEIPVAEASELLRFLGD